MEILVRQRRTEPTRELLALRRRWPNWPAGAVPRAGSSRDRRYDIGAPLRTADAQLALALNGRDRDEVLSRSWWNCWPRARMAAAAGSAQ